MKIKFPFAAYFELIKPRILTLVLVTTTLGYFLGGKGFHSLGHFLYLLLGTGLVCGGSGALNHYWEREEDAKMLRTKNRPIPLGIVMPFQALAFGIILILSGISIFYAAINLLTAFLSLLTAFLYILVYTPMKKMSWLNTIIGSIPGALPPMGGWTAATGTIDGGAWILFGILFLWQQPHFYAIAWMFKDDYKRGGFKMLPVIEPDGRRTFKQIIYCLAALIPVSLLPTMIGMSGKIYFAGALITGLALFGVGNNFIKTKSIIDARKLLQATVIYLPVLLFLIIIDTKF